MPRDFLDDLRPATVAGNTGAIYRTISVRHITIYVAAASDRLQSGRDIAFRRSGTVILADHRRADRATFRWLLGFAAGRGHASLGVRSRSRSMRWRMSGTT